MIKKKVVKKQNVSIGKKNYEIVAKFCKTNGYKIGWFFESSAIKEIEKLLNA